MVLDATGSGSLSPGISARVEGDKIRIGNQLYAYIVDGKEIKDPDLLASVANVMNDELVKREVEHAASQSAIFHLKDSEVTVLTSTNQPEMRLNFSKDEESYNTALDAIKSRSEQKDAIQKGIQTLTQKYGQDIVRGAISHAMNRPNLKLAYAMEQNRSLPAMRSLWQLLQEPGNKSVQAEVLKLMSTHEPSKLNKKKLQACTNELTILILENLQRNPNTYGRMVQNFNKGKQAIPDTPFANANLPRTLRADTFRTPNRAYPNRIDKGLTSIRPDVLQHNVNLGCIFDGKKEVVVNRSGMSYTPMRLYEVVQDALLNQISVENPRGLSENKAGELDSNGNPILVFEHAIDTHLDYSQLKAFTAPENERKFLQKLMQARDKWPQEGIRVKVLTNDVERTVILKRPIVRNQILSGFTAYRIPGPIPASVQNAFNAKRDSQRLSFVANQQLLMRFLAAEDLAPLREKAEMLVNKLAKPNLIADNGMIDFERLSPLDLLNLGNAFFESKEFKAYYSALARFVLERVKDDRTLIAYSAIFQRALPGEHPATIEQRAQSAMQSIAKNGFALAPPIEEELSSSDIQIYTNLLLKELNLSSGKQCLSGKDRTGISIALASAQSRFLEQKGKNFLPHANDASLYDFQKYFTESLETFAMLPTTESTGEPGLKIGTGFGNPNINQYLTSDYIKERTRHPYSGKLIDRGAIFGLTDSKARKRVAELQHSLEKGGKNYQAARRATEQLEKLFDEKLQLAVGQTKKHYFSSSFELLVPLADLYLNGCPTGNPRTRIDMLREELRRLESTSDNSMQVKLIKYALTEVVRLYEKESLATEAIKLLPQKSIKPPSQRTPLASWARSAARISRFRPPPN